MNHRRLVSLYPAMWRRRYEDEFLALLEERPPTAVQVLDIAWSALDAHLFPQAPEGRFRMFTRIAGIAALGAGLALLAGLVVPLDGPTTAYRALAFYSLALVGLVGIQLRQVSVRPALAWLGFASGLFGIAMGMSILALSMSGALPPTGGELGYLSGVALWIGAAVLGASLLAIGVFPMPVGFAFAVGSPLAMIGLMAGNVEFAYGLLTTVAHVGIVLHALAWAGVGISLLAAQPREGVLGPAT